MDRRIIYQQSVGRAENPDLQFHLDRLEKLEMIQQLAVLNEAAIRISKFPPG